MSDVDSCKIKRQFQMNLRIMYIMSHFKSLKWFWGELTHDVWVLQAEILGLEPIPCDGYEPSSNEEELLKHLAQTFHSHLDYWKCLHTLLMQNFKYMCNLLCLVHKLRNKYVLMEKKVLMYLPCRWICLGIDLALLFILPISADLVSLIPRGGKELFIHFLSFFLIEDCSKEIV